MLNVGGLPAGSSKITREQIIEALGYVPGPGVNLLVGTNCGTKNWMAYREDGHTRIEQVILPDGTNAIKYVTTSGYTGTGYFLFICDDLRNGVRNISKFESFTDYVVSFKMKAESNFTARAAFNDDWGSRGLTNAFDINIPADEQWHTVTQKITTKDIQAVLNAGNQKSYYVGFKISEMNPSGPVSVILRDLKVEPKDITTSHIWTPAPEDVVVRAELEDIFCSAIPNDLLEYADKGGATSIRFTFTNINTENTPYKSNLTGSTAGEAFIIGVGDYQTILYIPSAGTDIFIRVKNGGNWGEWRKIESTIAVASDEPTDDMEIN